VANEELVRQVKEIVGRAKLGDLDGAYLGYRDLFASPAFAERDIEWVPERMVTALDPDRKVAVCSDGSEIPYDLFLGVPFNIASYALLTQLIAQHAGLEPGDFIWTGGDCHIYDNHVDQVTEQLTRQAYPFPRLAVDPAPSLFAHRYEDLHLVDYRHHPALRAPVAV